MRFGDSSVGQAVYFDGFDDDEKDILVLGYIKSIHSDVDNVIKVRVGVGQSDMIVNITRLSPAKGVF